MTINSIRNHQDYRAALAQIDALGDPLEGSDEYAILDALVTLVEVYENRHHPICMPDPISTIEYELEKRGLTRKDLEKIIGPSGRVSEVLNRQRPLTMTMIRKLHAAYNISPAVLITSYPLDKPPHGRGRVRGLQTPQAAATR